MAIAITLASAHASAQTEAYDDVEPIALDQLIPESLIASGQHRITATRRFSEHFMSFDIEAEATGKQSVVSIPLAVLRVQEALTLSQAIDQFQQDNRRLADDQRGPISVRGDSIAAIVTSPFSTGAEVVGQFGRNVGQTVGEFGTFPGRQQNPPAPGVPETDNPILASYRRSVAGQLNLDVYSTNPSVQSFLSFMARTREGGNTRAGITTVSISRPPEVSVAGGQVQERIRSSVLNEELGALFERNGKLLDQSGIAPELAKRFLDQPVLSPTHKSAITEYAAFMEGVGNRGALVEAALDARNEVEALSKVQVARMYAYYHSEFTPLRELVAGGHLALAVNRDGALMVALPFDVLAWTSQSDRVFTALAEFAENKGATSRLVLLTGIATERADAALEQRGFRIFQRFLFRR